MSAYSVPRGLRGRHLQSVMATSLVRGRRVAKISASFQAASEHLVADCGDGVRLLVQHAPPAGETGRTAVLIHGWEGCGGSAYILSAGNRLWRSGFRVVRLNLRDHGDSLHLNEGLFHSCRIDETVGAVRWVAERFAGEEISLAGFSLGGNFALRIAARAPAVGLGIRRVAAICPVLDPARTMAAIDRGWPVYRWYFMRRWRQSLERKQAMFPAVYNFDGLDNFRTLETMTEFFVRRYTEFPDLQSYLAGYTLTDGRLLTVKAPSRILVARDDPVIPFADVDRVPRPAGLALDVTQHGGHGGFVKDYRLNTWVDDYILRTLASP